MAKRKILNTKIPSIETKWDDGENAYSGEAVEEFIKEQFKSNNSDVAKEASRAKSEEARLYNAICTEVSRATSAELANSTLINKETSKRQTEISRVESLVEAHTSVSEERFNSVNESIENAVSIAKDYANSVASGALKWQGVVDSLDDLPASSEKGDFYTVASENNTEYAWDGDKWMNIGADIDFTEVRSNIAANESAIASESSRAQLAELANKNAIIAEKERATVSEEECKSLIEDEANRALEAEALKANVSDVYKKTETHSKIEIADLLSTKASVTSLLSEIQRASAAEKKNADAIDALEKQSASDISSLLKKINDEVKDRKEAIDASLSAIEKEKQRAMLEEQRLDRVKAEKNFITDIMIDNLN